MDIAQEVSEILLAPYDDLKKAILDRTQSATAEWISQLLAQQPVGDHNLSVECDWPEMTLEEDFRRQVSIKRLQAYIQLLLTPGHPCRNGRPDSRHN